MCRPMNLLLTRSRRLCLECRTPLETLSALFALFVSSSLSLASTDLPPLLPPGVSTIPPSLCLSTTSYPNADAEPQLRRSIAPPAVDAIPPEKSHQSNFSDSLYFTLGCLRLLANFYRSRPDTLTYVLLPLSPEKGIRNTLRR